MRLVGCFWFGIGLLSLSSLGLADDAPVSIDYSTHVKPLLMKHCVKCHGAQKQQSGLRVDTAKGSLNGGDSGPAVVPGEPSKSLLIHAVTGTEGASRMPPDGPGLTVDEIHLLKTWIANGALAPADEIAEATSRKSSPHWAFQPIGKQRPPESIHSGIVHGPIDLFIQSALERVQLAPSAEADKRTLIRRASLDLLGIPPTLDDVREFTSDTSPDAYEKLVDRLLASPHFGERWGRDWLDVARYADSNGFTRDMPRTIWKYRDWVIDALNRNLPFDEFVIDQLAGDMRSNPRLDQIVATGFHRNTLINEEGGTDPEQFRVESIIDRVNTTGTVFLGLTIGCAQCHDHKYDPISQREYYQLYAFFNNTLFSGGDPTAPRVDVPSSDQISQGEPERQKQIRAEIARLDKELKDQSDAIAADLTEWEQSLSDDDKKKLPFNVKNAVDLPQRDRSATHKRDLDAYFREQEVARRKYPALEQIARLRAEEPKFPSTMVMQELPQPRETTIHLRGDFLRKGAKVTPGIPEIVDGATQRTVTESSDKSTAIFRTRLDLAKWLVSPDNPLTSRVTVNRIWLKYFGRGIVETENDFGTQASSPSHPELLDWLAREFSEHAWDTKRLHRVIVNSATYRQSSVHRADIAQTDPVNRMLARQNRLRLDAEVIRDQALAASGLLTAELGGPPVYPPQPDGVFEFTQDKKPWKTAIDRNRYRKAMYTQLWRSSLFPSLTVFDFPDANVTCTRRIRSNTPLQSLTLANDLTFAEFARGLAVRLLSIPSIDDSQRLVNACELCLAREPSSHELARLIAYLQQQRVQFFADEKSTLEFATSWRPRDIAAGEAAAWASVARVLMNLDEFITRE